MFIAFDGTDGVGKSTQVSLLNEYFLKKGKNTFLYDMGAFSTIGKYIKKLKHNDYNCSAELRELLYYYEGQLFSEWYTEGNQAKIVLCDRWILTYLSYGPINGMPIRDVKYFVSKFVKPDYYFLLDLEVSVALRRIECYRTIDNAEIGYKDKISGEEVDRIKFLKTQNILQKNFKQSSSIYDGKVIKINASFSQNEIFEKIVGYINNKLF